MYHVTITIGRNVDGAPMPRERWEVFRSLTEKMLRNYAPEFVQRYDAVSEWNGIAEESSCFVATYDDGDEDGWCGPVGGCEYLAGRFGQEAIFLGVGPGALVKGAS